MTLENSSDSEPKRHHVISPEYPKIAYSIRDGAQAICNTKDQFHSFVAQHTNIQSCPFQRSHF